jgi:hypothetical protein
MNAQKIASELAQSYASEVLVLRQKLESLTLFCIDISNDLDDVLSGDAEEVPQMLLSMRSKIDQEMFNDCK